MDGQRRNGFGCRSCSGCSILGKGCGSPGVRADDHWIGRYQRFRYRSSLRQTVRAATIIVAGFLIVAGPWIGILSDKYGHLVFSTTVRINHAIVGPLDMDRYHTCRTAFHKPETGRVTSWEDRTLCRTSIGLRLRMSHMLSKVRRIFSNAHLIVRHMKDFDWLGLGLVSAIFGYLFGTPWRKSLQEERWRWALIPIVSLAVMYLPVYAEAERYYLAALPFLIAASFGFALSLSDSIAKPHAVKRALALTLVSLSFAFGNEEFFRKAFNPSESANHDYLAAKILSDKLRGTDLVGPIASVGT